MPAKEREWGSFWDWFVVGFLAGVIYAVARNPQGLCCCLLLVIVLALVLGAVLLAFALALWEYLVLALAVYAAGRYVVLPLLRRRGEDA